MDAVASVEHLAALLASPPRRRILEILLDGHPRSATELGIISQVAFNTASTHIAKLVDAGLVAFERSGRHRFYRVSGPHVVDVMEALYELLPGQERQRERRLTEIEEARTCYDHLAGRLGASLTHAMVLQGYLRSHGKDFLLPKARSPSSRISALT
jgi:DNA-binding transcriptional ArsR family regulator